MKKLRQFALLALACGFAAALAPSVRADDPILPERLGEAQRQEWRELSARNLESGIGELLAAILREYGAAGAEQAAYRQGSSSLNVTVCEMQDRSGAYGAFTFLRGRAPAVFYQGNYLVLPDRRTPLPLQRALAATLAARSHDQASLPLLPEYLPEERLVKGSDAYVLGPLGLSRVAPLGQGDWVGFAYGAEVEVARYRINQREATLLLVSYPTPHIARARLADFQRTFNLNGQGGNGPVVYAKRKSTLVVLVHGAESAEEAARLIDAVRFQQEISWSEPTPPDESEIVSGLIGIFLGTGVILIVTLGLGLAFGAARLLLMSTLPGRVFDKPVENDTIFLNLQNPK